MQFFFNKYRYRTEVTPGRYRLIATRDGASPEVYVSVPEGDIWEYAKEYALEIEKGETDKLCSCLWRIHPDDMRVKSGHCRECDEKQKHAIHSADPSHASVHVFRGIRKTRVDTDPRCPVHTKEGFLNYFFEWLKKQ